MSICSLFFYAILCFSPSFPGIFLRAGGENIGIFAFFSPRLRIGAHYILQTGFRGMGRVLMSHNKIKLDMDEAHLSNYAENRAREIGITGSVRPRRYYRQIRRRLKAIQRTCQRASLAAAGRRRIPKMLEWLLDNWYIAEREGLQAAMDLRRAGPLPASGRRVSALALLADSFIQMDCSRVSARHISLFLKSAQKVRPLTENELGLFVTMLKTALIDRLYALCPEIDKAAQRLRKKKEKSPFEGFLSGEAAENREDVEEISDIFTCLRTLSSLDLSDAISSADHLDEVLGRRSRRDLLLHG